MKKLFITSTGTQIGKTFVTAALTHQLQMKGSIVNAVKPIISGWDDEVENDTKILLNAMNKPINQRNIHSCSPWRFRAPVAPSMAAKQEGRKIILDEVVTFCNGLGADNEDYILVEGIGGVMVPINDTKMVLDLILRVKMPVLLVAGSYLGSISHTLTALAALESKKIRNVSIVISESPDSPVTAAETAKSIEHFCNAPITILPRVAGYQDAADLTNII